MKKIFLVLSLVLTVSVANAWEKRPDEGVVLLATKHLSAEAKAVVARYLGDSFDDDVRYLNTLEQKKTSPYTREVHYLHLDSNLLPVRGEGEDALAEIEKAVEVVRARSSHSAAEVTKALRVIINLMCDMHNFTYVRIEGVPQSQKPFVFTCYAGDIGSRKTTSNIRWSKFWESYTYWHGGFSGSLWAEDLELCLGSKFSEYSQGDLNDWTKQIGEKAAELYARINPEYVMTRRERNELEMLNYEMMARAGFRLAALLNSVIN